MASSKYGNGCWDTITKNGIQYVRFRKNYPGFSGTKSFTGKTKAAVKKKIEKFEKEDLHVTDTNYKKMTLAQCTRWALDKEGPTMKASNLATLEGTYHDYIENPPLRIISDLKAKHTAKHLGEQQLGNISSDMIFEFYVSMSKVYSESTVIKCRTLLNHVFNYLVNKKIITINPAKGVRLPNKSKYAVQKKAPSFLSLDQSELFYRTIKMDGEPGLPGVKFDEPIYTGICVWMLLFILYTGLRAGEAYALRWQDVNFNNRTVSVTSSKERIKIDGKYVWHTDYVKRPKSERTVPLSNRAYEALLHAKAIHPNASKSDFIFLTKNGKEPALSTLRRTLHTVLKRAGINPDGFGVHDLRHSFGSLLIEKGYRENHPVDLQTISVLLGHESVEITSKIYLHMTLGHTRSVLQLLNE